MPTDGAMRAAKAIQEGGYLYVGTPDRDLPEIAEIIEREMEPTQANMNEREKRWRATCTGQFPEPSPADDFGQRIEVVSSGPMRLEYGGIIIPVDGCEHVMPDGTTIRANSENST